MNRLFGVIRRRPGIVDTQTPFKYGVDGYRLKWAPNFDATFTALFTSSNVGYRDPNVVYVDAQPLGGFADNGGRNVRMVFNPSSYSTILTGTFDVTHGMNTVTPSLSQVGVVYPGSLITFASQPGVNYVVDTVTSAPAITLTTNYTGTTNAATTATMPLNDNSSFWLQFAQVTGVSETLVGAPTLILPDSAHRGIGIVTIHGAAPSGATSADSLQIDLPGLMEDIRIHNEDTSNYLYVSTEQSGPETQLKPDTFSQFTNIRGAQGSIWVRGATSGGTGAVVEFSATMTKAFPR